MTELRGADKIAAWTGAGIIVLAVIAALLFGEAYLLQIAWNFVVPDLFGFKALTFWQAFALMFITNLLFGVVRGGRRR